VADLSDRDGIEGTFADALAKELARFARMLGSAIPGLESAFASIPQEEWNRHTDKLNGIITPTLSSVFRTRAQDIIRDLGFTDIDWGLIDAESAAWARNYAGRLIGGITDTSQARVRQLVSDYFEKQQTQGELVNKLLLDKELRQALTADGGTFSRSRAEMIARTEVTQAVSESTQETKRHLASQGFEMVPIWNTRNDEILRSCPICAPRHNLEIKPDNATMGQYPPGHPRCRCWPTLELPE